MTADSLDFWTVYWPFVAFVFGAIVGSFLNVCIWRLPRGESLSDPPSHCPACGHRLSFLPDMVPLLSQLWYRSRCRYCGVHFSWRYFWVELLTAVTFTVLFFRYHYFAPPALGDLERTLSGVAAMAFAAALIVIFFIDLEQYQIPDLAVYVALAAGVGIDLFLIARGVRPLWRAVPGTPWSIPLPLSIIGGLAAFWFLWQFAALSTALLAREAMGAGDSMLLAAMGAFLVPWPLVVTAFLLAVFLGTIGGLAGLWLARRAPVDEAVEETALEADASAAMPPTEEAIAVPAAHIEARGEWRAASGGRPLGPREASGEGETAVSASAAPEAPAAVATSQGIEATDLAGAVDSEGEQETDGAAPEEPAEGERHVPELPPASRWGRLWTVAGTWMGVAGLWGGAILAARSLPAGLAFGAALLAGAAWVLNRGIREWVRGDKEWLPEMDTFFEEDPGPRFIPFGPYLVVGSLIAVLFGRAIVEWYVAHLMDLPASAVAGWGWN